MVVAVGSADEALMALARTAPKRIEPLVLRPGRRNVLELLREAWADEPLDIYADFLPLCAGAEQPASADLFSKSAGMAAALLRGVQAGRACCVMAIPEVSSVQNGSPEDHAKTAGYTALLKRLSNEGQPGRYIGIRLLDMAIPWTEAQCTSAGDLVLTLFHPVSRGMRNGSVVDWDPVGVVASD